MQATSQVLKQTNIGTRTGGLLKMLSHQATCAAVDALIPADAVASMSKTGIYRTVEACALIASGDVRNLDPVTGFLVAGLMLTTQPSVTYRDLHFLCGANRDNTSNLNGVSRARLSRFLAPKTKSGQSMSLGTITSKVSRTVGKGGLLRALGIVTRNDAHSVTLSDSARTAPFMLAYATALQSITDGALALVRDSE